jgi:hypothetical protein
MSVLAVICGLSAIACNKQNFGVVQDQMEFGQTVKYSKDVDILWVVDTSSSMSTHQNLLAEQVSNFVASLDTLGMSYQMGVTTMDMSASGAKGRFVSANGTPPVLTPASPNMLSVLSSRLRLGENGSPVERGLEAMMMALSAPNITTGPNAGFLRTDSLLVVNFLTNEDDTASVSHDYVAFLDQLRPPTAYGDRSWVANFMGVMPNDPTCTTMGQYVSAGNAYIALANASGGAKESICDGDLRRALAGVKARVLEIATEYVLERKPNVATIVVMVDGAAVPTSESNGWTYYQANNSVRFHGEAIPKPNSRIRVTFDPAELH